MNIVYVNHYAGAPSYGMEYRPYYLAREWVRAGHQVMMLAATQSHVRALQPTAGDELIDGIRYRWYPTPGYQGNGIGRVRNIWSFLRQVWADTAAVVTEFRPDIVIASSTYPMDIWPCRRMARQAKAKLVFELHDLWPLSPIEIGGMSPHHPFIMLCQAAENAAYRQADLVVSMLPHVDGHAAEKGLPLERLVVVPNGTALEEWAPTATVPLRADVHACLVEARAAHHKVVVYAGSHGTPNALDTLLDAAASLRDQPIEFVLVGDGHERDRLLGRVRDERLGAVHMFEPIPKAQMPELLSLVDMAYLGAPRHPLYRYGVSPNKMIDYMMAGVPILYAIEAGNAPVADAACGVQVASENAAALAAAITDLVGLPKAALSQMGANGKAYALAHHTYQALAHQFLDAVMHVEAGR